MGKLWKITIFHGRTHYFYGHFSIAMQMFTRGYELNQPESAGEKNLCLNYSKWFVKKNHGMLGKKSPTILGDSSSFSPSHLPFGRIQYTPFSDTDLSNPYKMWTISWDILSIVSCSHIDWASGADAVCENTTSQVHSLAKPRSKIYKGLTPLEHRLQCSNMLSSGSLTQPWKMVQS